MSTAVDTLKIRLFADCAHPSSIRELAANRLIQGFTTNPTLMRKAGITDYEAFSKEMLAIVPDRPVSLEVFADDFAEMDRQARKISTWGENVYVKIPVTNTLAEPALDLICRLSHSGMKVNVTALLSLQQVYEVATKLAGGAPSFISVFAGRIADTGVDPIPLMAAAVQIASMFPSIQLIWASPRELLNVFQADSIGCHIITATPEILGKLQLVGRDLTEYSLDTVKMFYNDACLSGFQL